ncbi:MAG: SUMF1/EgtB/PvdO family nonheme iron enzyme [Lamprobacter sp.]|uniref:SUMF1/EgtB/PvdO family nonheme iron enzyme n=1 Tax=Lamprobacter sp. TaxID=3100796 RepID=UPI002B2633D9|nr:SUMF1/EgtB/PvdO family nonheme iron enzyme [Lamprobacter sp.]MEA3640546.1 SUMF1/EgtB/PvdO family nonheme iron enzyme [Lamprobacter sp.]
MMEIPGYTIIRELGRGGMATVYLAKQERLGRKVALKVMQPLPNTGDDFTARFIKEGRIIAQLQHPKIVTIYDFDIVDGYHYFSMEHLPNGTLSDAILKGMSPERAVEITCGIAEALAVAHDHGVIHRDIKPQNVLFRADGTPVLTDFGIARAAGAGADMTQVTNFGMIIGSPRYMSPEQSQSKPVDARSDLYSLGVAFYEMLTKELPYQANDVVSLAMKHCSAPIPVLEGSLKRYQPILEKLLAKRPEERFGSAQELISALNSLKADGRIETEPRADATRLIGTPPHKAERTDLQQTGNHQTQPHGRSRLPMLAGIGVTAALIGVLGWYLANSRDTPSPQPFELPEAVGPRPPGAKNYEVLASEHLSEGEFQESLQVLRLALSQFPGDPRLEALQAHAEDQLRAQDDQRKATALLEADDLEEAEALITAGLERVEDHPGLLKLREQLAQRRQQKDAEKLAALKQQAEQALSQGNLSEGMRLIEDALQIQPDNSSAQALARRIEAALEEEKTLAQFIEQAKQLIADDLLPRALELIDKGLDSAPEHPELVDLRKTVNAQLLRSASQLADRAEEATANGQFQEAIAMIEQALQLVPNNPEIQAIHQRILDEQRHNRAEKFFDQARQVLAEGRLQEALSLADQGLAMQPDHLGLFTFREMLNAEVESKRRTQQAEQQIRVHLDEDQLDDALSLAERALQRDPQSSALAALKSEILVRQKKRKPDQLDEFLRQASGLYREGHLDAAFQIIQQGLALAPDHVNLASLGALVDQARQEQARLEQQLNDCASAFAEPADAKAEVLAFAEAARCYQTLLESDSSNRQALGQLRQIRSRLSERFDARLQQGDVDTAAMIITTLEAIDASDANLGERRAQLTRQLTLTPRTIAVPEGCFQIGSPPSEPTREPDEEQTQICLEPFELALRETTVADFQRFATETGYETDAEKAVGGAPGCFTLDLDSPGDSWAYHPWATWRQPNKYQSSRGDLPVSCVSRNDAEAYIHWLNEQTGGGYRLPTEAEWEYAARAGTLSSRFWGEAIDASACEYANVADAGHEWNDGFPCNDGHEWAAPVGIFTPNPWGLFDMLGNLSEWTCSSYKHRYVGAESSCASIDSRDPISLRGGAWNSGPEVLRAAYRNRNYPESRYSFVGFRVAKEIVKP